MAQSNRNPSGTPARSSGSRHNQEDRPDPSDRSQQSASSDRATQRARTRSRAFRDGMQEGDEGQGEWESSGRTRGEF
jgi:hypothetical protein